MWEVLVNNFIIPKGAAHIIKTLRDNGYEAYAVGGCVRDSILGHVPEDWDITTRALPHEVKGLFSHVIDTGIEHGTVTVLKYGESFEVTTYRIDGKYSDGRHPDKVQFTPSLEEDLKRRDFTINAMAYDPEEGLVDLFGGIEDLKNGIIKAVGDPDQRFTEDALRIMRAVRFAAQLSFEIEPATYAAISEHAENLGRVSMERIRVEFEKTLMSDNPGYVDLYKDLGLAPYIIRDKKICARCFDPAAEKLYTAFEVSGSALRYLRLAAFFKNVDAGNVKTALRSLTYDNKTKSHVSNIVKYKDYNVLPDRKMIKLAMLEMGDDDFDLVMAYKAAVLKTEVAYGDMRCAQARDERNIEDIVEIADEIRAKGEPYKISMLDVSGKDLIEAGMEKGSAIGEKLNELLMKVIEDPGLNEKSRLLEMMHKENSFAMLKI